MDLRLDGLAVVAAGGVILFQPCPPSDVASNSPPKERSHPCVSFAKLIWLILTPAGLHGASDADRATLVAEIPAPLLCSNVNSRSGHPAASH